MYLLKLLFDNTPSKISLWAANPSENLSIFCLFAISTFGQTVKWPGPLSITEVNYALCLCRCKEFVGFDWSSLKGRRLGFDWSSLRGRRLGFDWPSLRGRRLGFDWLSMRGRTLGFDWPSLRGR